MIEAKREALDARVKARQAQAAAALQQFCPDLPVDELKKTFGGGVSYLRTPAFDYGHDPLEGLQRVPISPKPVKWVKKGSQRRIDVAEYTQGK